MIGVNDYFYLDYGLDNRLFNNIYLSQWRDFNNIFHTSFPVLKASYKGNIILSVSHEIGSVLLEDEDPIRFVFNHEDSAKVLKVCKFLVANKVRGAQKIQGRFLATEEVMRMYPKFNLDTVSRYCMEKRFYGVVIEDEVIALGIYTRMETLFEEISIRVRKSHQNKGYGRILTAEMINMTIEKNKLFVYTCEEQNTASIRLINGLETLYRQEEVVVLVKSNPTSA